MASAGSDIDDAFVTQFESDVKLAYHADGLPTFARPSARRWTSRAAPTVCRRWAW